MNEESTSPEVVLEPLSSASKFGRSPPGDYDVRCGSKIVGRIMQFYYAPPDKPWAWAINAFERGERPVGKCQGFAVDLRSALDAFRAAWIGEQRQEKNEI